VNRGDDPGEMGDSLPAVSLGTEKTAVAITTGALHACALLNDASVKCWGYNYSSQLGTGEDGNRGDQPNEMGDNLPAVKLFSTLW
jgi:alpha-tubulin suppressor-like RCC1 family protein